MSEPEKEPAAEPVIYPTQALLDQVATLKAELAKQMQVRLDNQMQADMPKYLPAPLKETPMPAHVEKPHGALRDPQVTRLASGAVCIDY